MGVLTKSQQETLSGEIEASNQRRLNELQALFSVQKELSELYHPAPFILAGDLNSTPDSEVYKKIIEEHKLKDSRGEPSPETSSEFWTWDPPANKENHKYSINYGISVSDFGKTEVQDFFKKYDRRQRRIDYVFVDPGIQVLSYQLFANEANSEGTIASDHFGIQVELATPDGD